MLSIRFIYFSLFLNFKDEYQPVKSSRRVKQCRCNLLKWYLKLWSLFVLSNSWDNVDEKDENEGKEKISKVNSKVFPFFVATHFWQIVHVISKTCAE